MQNPQIQVNCIHNLIHPMQAPHPSEYQKGTPHTITNHHFTVPQPWQPITISYLPILDISYTWNQMWPFRWKVKEEQQRVSNSLLSKLFHNTPNTTFHVYYLISMSSQNRTIKPIFKPGHHHATTKLLDDKNIKRPPLAPYHRYTYSLTQNPGVYPKVYKYT